MGTDKRKLQGTIVNEVELEDVNQEGCLLGLLKSLIEEQKLFPKIESEKLACEVVMEPQS
jgi:hypothetical protein